MWPVFSAAALLGLLYAASKKSTLSKTLTDEELLNIVLAESSRLAVSPAAAMAVLEVESGGKPFIADRLVIRFEPHIYKRYAGKSPPKYSVSDTANQQDRMWAQLEAAFEENPEAALKSISMGSSQIMGFNHKLIGYPTVEDMWIAFNRGEDAHIFGLFSYFENRSGMLSALRALDFDSIARKYNGDSTGTYEKKFISAYKKWKAVLGD